MKKIMFFALLLVCPMMAFAQEHRPADHTKVVFMFEPQDDMFYMRESTPNQREWARLSDFVNKHKTIIRNGEIKVHVTSYSVAMHSAPSNRLLAKTMANRVKTELILKNGLKEEDFKTLNKAETYEGKAPVVVVEITIPEKNAPAPKPAPAPAPKPEPAPAPKPAPAPQPEPEPVIAPVEYSHWTLGVNVGVPFFHGDMVSWEANNHCYFGIMAGLQLGYQISPAFGLSLTADYGANKAGPRIRDKRYYLSPQGNMYERFEELPANVTGVEFTDIHQKSSLINLGLHLDINLNKIFASRPNRLNVILSPAVYGQNFTSKILNDGDDKQYVTDKYNGWNLGLGGDLALRLRASDAVDVQLKGLGIWINKDKYDGIHENNIKKYTHWMWGVQAGVIFKLGGNHRTNILYK